ncbi:hypothetical protein Pyn_39075 [Prunus yedoensis var. nudiflora]|uniref:Uncharacterized protein n=1 Tax=Prunus yedoensis var. nudiflora TaxID=2094558 RepID=A0A314ULW0_PRUYE|nr:hypothetical protein Pyn_39075 [Prunus yedoensis var. nudiflora]
MLFSSRGPLFPTPPTLPFQSTTILVFIIPTFVVLLLFLTVPSAHRAPSPGSHFRAINRRICDESCALECHGNMLLRPPTHCDTCLRRCNIQLPPSLYQCTAGCAYNFITSTSQSTDHSVAAAAEEVKRHVGSCYKKCNQIVCSILVSNASFVVLHFQSLHQNPSSSP